MIKVIVFYDLNVLWLPFSPASGTGDGRGKGSSFYRSFIERLLNTVGKVKAQSYSN